MAEKSDYQKEIENMSGLKAGGWPVVERRRITKEVPYSPGKVGEIITVKRWGTFGCWDENNRWIDFYSSESI